MKAKGKNIGKVTVALIMIIMLYAFIASWIVTNKVQAAITIPSHTLVIPDDGYAALWVTFWNTETGDMYNATTGAVDATFTNCDVDANKHSTNTGAWTLTVPPLNSGNPISINYYDSATPADTDTPVKSVRYSPVLKRTFGDGELNAE